MQEQLNRFVVSLRSTGVPVSLAESIEAHKALRVCGIQDRETFRHCLRSTLVKTRADQAHFDRLFPHFFNLTPFPSSFQVADDLSREEKALLYKALAALTPGLLEAMERLMGGAGLEPAELEDLARRAGLQHANDLRFLGWITRRMEQGLELERLRQALPELEAALRAVGMQPERIQEILLAVGATLEGLKEQIGLFAGQRIAENLQGREERRTLELLDVPLSSIKEEQMAILREQVKRLAALLRSRVALRQKRAKSGQLDSKATIRANLRHAGIPFDLRHRKKHIQPKLVVLCDISTSMRYCSELMLSLLYELQGLIAHSKAFTFIDHLEEITSEFSQHPAKQAVEGVLRRNPPGYYSTDLGNSLVDFESKFMHMIDSRTSFIIVGDGRNNYNHPRLEIFQKICQRSRRTIWINPEDRRQWQSGDSDMGLYAPMCSDILKAGTLNELIAAVDSLMG